MRFRFPDLQKWETDALVIRSTRLVADKRTKGDGVLQVNVLLAKVATISHSPASLIPSTTLTLNVPHFTYYPSTSSYTSAPPITPDPDPDPDQTQTRPSLTSIPGWLLLLTYEWL